MTVTSEAGDPAAKAKPRKRTTMDVIRALKQPKVSVMMALGFSSGLPFMLIGNTLALWLAEDHIKLAAIGYLSWAGLAYLWKFIWGAIVDHLPAPLLRSMGRRRGWMILTQIAVGVGLVGMAMTGPSHLPWLAFFSVVTGIAAAMQDTVVDAWRIEIADDADELGLLTSSYSLGYRIALFGTEALILLAATAWGWPLSYALFGGAMAVGVIASIVAREPIQADRAMQANEAGRNAAQRGVDAVWGPFQNFFQSHGVALGALMLLVITLYHLCDYLRGPMSNPYYIALGMTKPMIAAVRGGIGLPMTFVGIAVGGLASLRLGARTSLLIGAILQPLAVASFALLAWHGHDFPIYSAGGAQVTAFEVIMGCDSFCMAFSGVALIAYMSSLTSLGYTATQYALLTSAMAWSGKILKGFSGAMVESLQHGGRTLIQAYGDFYLLSAAIGIPAILACLWLLSLQIKRGPVRVYPSEASAPSS